MKRKNRNILCFSVFLILIAALFGITEIDWKKQHSISVDVLSGGRAERVNLWMNASEEFFLFLPSYADLSQVQIRRNIGGRIYLDDKKVTESMDCSGLPLEEPLALIWDPPLGYQWNEVTILQSANVATMYIDVQSGNMDYIHAEKGNKEAGIMRLYSVDGQLDAVTMVDALQGRGNSTWLWQEKKPYSLRLTEETDLLGMGQASRWVLLADAFDRSLLKNKTAYDLAGNAGMPYAPDCQWVDLYLNGTYAGLYLLCERNEIHPNRVDIPEESSFLVSWEAEARMIAQNYPYVKTERGTALRIHQSAFPSERIAQIWQSVENAIFAEDSIDPITGKHLEELIDLDSWADLFLLDEISADFDGGVISRFFYYKETDGVGKVYGGPVWDKDDAFATGHWAITPPNCIVASRSYTVDGKEQKMFAGLYQKEVFSSRVAERYQTAFRPLLKDLYETGIEDYANRIAKAAQLTQIRWNLGNTPEQSLIVRDFVEARTEFLDAYWIRKEEFYRVNVYSPTEGSRGIFAVSGGDRVPILPEYEPELGIWGWYYAQTGEPYDVTQPVWEDLELLLRKVGQS